MTNHHITDSWLDSLLADAKQTPQILLITGPSGAGKTTWCSHLIEKARARGLSVGGVLSPGMFQDGEKAGIALIDLASDESRILAVPRIEGAAGITTSHWHFDGDVLAWGNQALAKPVGYDILIVDELGPLELERAEGLQAGLHAIDRHTYKVACVVVRPALLEKALQRWPGSPIINTAGD